MNWIRLSMKFPGTCIVCNQRIEINQIALWSKGVGVKHEKCIEAKQINCAICHLEAGCPTCEYHDDCNLDRVSELCICKQCLNNKDPFFLYLEAIKKTFPYLNRDA